MTEFPEYAVQKNVDIPELGLPDAALNKRCAFSVQLAVAQQA